MRYKYGAPTVLPASLQPEFLLPGRLVAAAPPPPILCDEGVAATGFRSAVPMLNECEFARV
jgi:hypothetical protein